MIRNIILRLASYYIQGVNRLADPAHTIPVVAAVSFQTSLNDTMDIVYLFIAVGIGLASGTQLTTVAYLASLAFVIITLGVWKSNYGAQQPVLSGWRVVSPGKSDQASEAGKKQE